jgi:lysophospholipase L1-like esterase
MLTQGASMAKRIKLQVLVGCTIACGFLLLPIGASKADEKKSENSAVQPVPRQAVWLKRHEAFAAMAQKGNIDVLFLGDSITDDWGGQGHNPKARGRELFAKDFEPLKTANFGIGGDRTEHVLWRLQHGELDGIHPKVAMLMIGTNNTPGAKANTAEQIAEGITAIVKEIRQRSPQTKILLLGIFPRGQAPTNPLREKIKQVNEIISKLDDGGKTVKYLDIGAKFLQPDGTLSQDIMYDYLHLTSKGYQIWADAVKEPIIEWLGKKVSKTESSP